MNSRDRETLNEAFGIRIPQVRDGLMPTDGWPGLDCKDPSKTDQSQAVDCDVNRIIDRFHRTGVLPGTDIQKTYGDFTAAPDFHAAMDIVQKAEEQFDSLDARTRARFGNDPAAFLEFATDAANQDEMIKLGLATRRAEAPGTVPPLDVTVPTDTKPKKGAAPKGDPEA